MPIRSLLPLLLLPALAGCEFFECENRIMARIGSPDGRRAAVMFVRSCGATTAFSKQLSLVRPGQTPTGGGNLFIAGGADHMPLVEWTGPDSLRITFRSDSPPRERFRDVDGVRIDYHSL